MPRLLSFLLSLALAAAPAGPAYANGNPIVNGKASAAGRPVSVPLSGAPAPLADAAGSLNLPSAAAGQALPEILSPAAAPATPALPAAELKAASPNVEKSAPPSPTAPEKDDKATALEKQLEAIKKIKDPANADIKLEELYHNGKSAPAAESAEAPRAASWTERIPGLRRVAGWITAAKPHGPPLYDSDDNGGPKPTYFSLRGRALYGLKWGVNFLGFTFLFQQTLQRLLDLAAWPLGLSESALQSVGRIELLIRFGPEAIEALVKHSPLAFLFSGLPLAVLAEELSRAVSFGMPLLLLWGARLFVAWAAGKDKDGQTPAWAKRLGKAVFPLAASFAAFNFALAHVPMWGFSPATFLLHGLLGLALIYILARSRSLLAPFMAHYAYNLVTILTGAAATIYLGAAAADTLYWVLGPLFAAGLYYNLAVARKDQVALHQGLEPASALERREAPKLRWRALGLAALMSALMLPSVFPIASAPKHAAPRPLPAKTILMPQRQAPPRPETVKKTPQEIIAEATPATIFIQVGNALGTGFIVDKGGLALTNAHVVSGAREGALVDVRLHDGRPTQARVASKNTKVDLAILELSPAELPNGAAADWPTLALGDSSQIRSGDPLIALGHPMGNPFSASRGIVSHVRRVNPYTDYIQTDATINPGNSGGPLLNEAGEVVGMNTMIMSRSGGSQGLGFAIHGNALRAAVSEFQKNKTISATWMGIIVDLHDSMEGRPGLVVEHVRPDSPAGRAGLKAGDIILAVNGRGLSNGQGGAVFQLRRGLVYVPPGAKLALAVQRETANGSEQIGIDLTLAHEDERPQTAIDRILRLLPPGLRAQMGPSLPEPPKPEHTAP